MPGLTYLDASAIVTLVVEENESSALRQAICERATIVPADTIFDAYAAWEGRLPAGRGDQRVVGRAAGMRPAATAIARFLSRSGA